MFKMDANICTYSHAHTHRLKIYIYIKWERKREYVLICFPGSGQVLHRTLRLSDNQTQ